MFSPIASRSRLDGLAGGLYYYHMGDIFTPGTQNYVFQPAYTLPTMQLIGAAIYSGPAPRTTSPQVIFATQVRRIAGMGGLFSGQFVQQPLNTPEGNGSL
jgi:hypothetical protein